MEKNHSPKAKNPQKKYEKPVLKLLGEMSKVTKKSFPGAGGGTEMMPKEPPPPFDR